MSSTIHSESRKTPRKRIRRIPDDQRQKVSSACDNCKKRKFKCSGQTPCLECLKKGIDCLYTIIDKRSLRGERMAKMKQQKEADAERQQQQHQQQQHYQPPPQQLLQHTQSPPQDYPQHHTYVSPDPSVYPSSLPVPGNQIQPPPPQVQGYSNHCSAFNSSHQLPPPQYQQQPQPMPQILLPFPTYHQPTQYQPIAPLSSTPSNSSSRNGSMGIPTPGTTPNASEVNNNNNNNNTSCIPKSLQPLLSFPLQSNERNMKPEEPPIDDNTSKLTVDKDGVSNQNGKSAILLMDKSGTFRYMGETSPLSVLYETRNIFYDYVGSTKLTEDLRGCPVSDRPLKLTIREVAPLPPLEERDTYIRSFKRNINDMYFTFEMNKFYDDIINPVYLNPTSEQVQEKRVQLYLVLAIGSTYEDFSNKIPQAEKGVMYHDSARFLIRDMVEDSALWCVICHYLHYHYYQSILKKSTALVHLNLAITYAQSLGLHRNFVNEQFSKFTSECEYRKRLFRSLYISDRISPVFIGRPLIINDYDWDDSTRFKPSNLLVSSLDFNAKCQVELTKICTLIGRIVANFYQDKVIDMERTKNLAIQLKLWSKNLDPQLAFDNILNPMEIADNEDHGNTCILLMMHLLQLWAIMLLSRPFFMFEAVRNINPGMQKSPAEDDDAKLRKQFCQAATKASILAIKIMNHYINTAFKEFKRMECYVIITCCFYSSIILGITILNGSYEEEGYTESELLNLLKNAEYILLHFAVCNEGAKRYAEISADLISALIQRHESKSTQTELGLNDFAYRLLNDFSFTDDPNNTDVQNLMDFQQFFVSLDLLTMDSGNVNNTTTSTLPFDYNNYNLFFGDKY